MMKVEKVVKGVVVVVVLGVTVTMVVVGGVVLSSVVDFGASVVKRVDRVVAVVVVKLGKGAEVEADVEGGVFQPVVVVVVGVVTALATALAVVLITRPNEAAVELAMVDVTVDDLVAVKGASRKRATSRGAVPNIAPAFRIECCLMLSENVPASITPLFPSSIIQPAPNTRKHN